MPAGAATHIEHSESPDIAERRTDLRFFERNERIGIVIVNHGPAVVTGLHALEGIGHDSRFPTQDGSAIFL